ncbi:MAG: hypothetical protein R3B07_23425 [Polyangiaceae bacterium]
MLDRLFTAALGAQAAIDLIGLGLSERGQLRRENGECGEGARGAEE